MDLIRFFRCRYGTLMVGIACLAGCHQVTRPPAPRRPPTLGLGEAPGTVTRTQEADVQVAFGRTAERRGDLDQAMSAYREALTRDKHRADAYQRLAVLHDRRGKFRQSAELYRQALEADPGNPEIFCDMGYSLYLQRRWAEAQQNLRQTLALRPDHARAHNNLGLVLAHDGRPEEALAEFRKAGNGDAEARGNLALALTLDGHWAEARQQYQAALAANPSAADSRDRLRELDRLVARTDARATRDPRLTPTSNPAAASPRPDAPGRSPATRPKTARPPEVKAARRPDDSAGPADGRPPGAPPTTSTTAPRRGPEVTVRLRPPEPYPGPGDVPSRRALTGTPPDPIHHRDVDARQHGFVTQSPDGRPTAPPGAAGPFLDLVTSQ